MKSLWKNIDIINLEYFLQRDAHKIAQGREEELIQRDRRFLRASGFQEKEIESDLVQKKLIRLWFEQRLEKHTEAAKGILPGAVWGEVLPLALWVISIVGFVGGLVSAAPFLAYTGKEPLNVILFFVIFVLLQFLLLVLQGGVAFFRGRGKGERPHSILLTLLKRGLMRILESRFTTREQIETTGEAAPFSFCLERSSVVFALFIWSLFILLQVGGLCFNLGVIGAVLAKVSFFDTAFGWQSSLQLSEELLAGIVQVIALPWSWFVPESLAYPDLEALKGSRVVLKEGIEHLETEALVSWWPFLCFSVAAYVVAPRLLLFCYGRMKLKSIARQAPQLTHSGLLQLLRRMKTPHVSTGGKVISEHKVEAAPAPPVAAEEAEPVEGFLSGTPLGCLLIPDELYDECPQEMLIERLEKKLPEAFPRELVFGYDLGEEQEVIDRLKDMLIKSSPASVVILQEGWQPPIEEMFGLLRDIRGVCGEKTVIRVLLVGKPSGSSILTEPTVQDVDIWKNKLAAQNDSAIETMLLNK